MPDPEGLQKDLIVLDLQANACLAHLVRHRDVLVLLVSVQILVRLDCFSHSHTADTSFQVTITHFLC